MGVLAELANVMKVAGEARRLTKAIADFADIKKKHQMLTAEMNHVNEVNRKLVAAIKLHRVEIQEDSVRHFEQDNKLWAIADKYSNGSI